MTLGEGNDAPPESPHRPTSVWSVVLRSIAILVAVTLTRGSVTAYLTYRHDWQAIKRINVSQDLVASRRAQSAEHSAHRFSIPRDSVVPILSCAPEDGTPGQAAQPAGVIEQLNATFANGGPGCLLTTIEQTTHIRINDFIELTFAGFQHVIDDIGGVTVCLPVAVHDPQSRLNLSAGKHHIYGREALAFWRVRYIGEGSDLQRIRRDQFLMASLIQGIERSRLLHSPTELLSVINDVAGHRYIAIARDSRLPRTSHPRLGSPRRAGVLGSSSAEIEPHRDGVAGPFPAAASGSARSAANRNLARQYGGITGSAPICGDASAFAGPDGYR